MDILRLFTIDPIVKPDIPKLAIAFVPVKTFNIARERREDPPGLSDGDDAYSIDGPDDGLDVFG